MTMENQEYVPFGEEWKKEMSKLLKTFLVEQLAAANIKRQETQDLLLQATQNLGHPAYEHSYSTHEAIDSLREKCFDFLCVPKA